ncbi:hypothetical protein M5K25_009096 [Dendrobium thyrsiflorum]|uniref:Uncharacterized protein n=1 Tax=Dendrobium thyrsiflorum TaxID=117978 RepID=A0ABD0V4X6_DENTH
MAAKKVDALEERLEGEMNQIKTTVEERISSMEGQVADLRDMIKKMLEVHNQTAASVAKSGEGRSTNSKIRREEEESKSKPRYRIADGKEDPLLSEHIDEIGCHQLLHNS